MPLPEDAKESENQKASWLWYPSRSSSVLRPQLNLTNNFPLEKESATEFRKGCKVFLILSLFFLPRKNGMLSWSWSIMTKPGISSREQLVFEEEICEKIQCFSTAGFFWMTSKWSEQTQDLMMSSLVPLNHSLSSTY